MKIIYRIVSISLVVILLSGIVAIPATATEGSIMTTDKDRYAIGQDVTIDMMGPDVAWTAMEIYWYITDDATGQVVAQSVSMSGPDLAPWVWDQTNTAGQQVGTGAYTVHAAGLMTYTPATFQIMGGQQIPVMNQYGKSQS